MECKVTLKSPEVYLSPTIPKQQMQNPNRILAQILVLIGVSIKVELRSLSKRELWNIKLDVIHGLTWG
uniref:Uncharacterized protein n=1 Tax=Rhizophora mucronata TaxID=61149 RepID=A0A2P2IPU4_RHIMU